MHFLRTIVLFAAVMMALTGVAAHADKRVALVIGNSAYKNVARLSNPANDAAAVVAMFKAAGFDSVDLQLDLNVIEMRRALREFGNKTRDADVAVVYYAGHGIELDGTNYLIPIDATLETDTDVLDETFPLDRVLFTVEPAKQLRLVILDACRDNPFAKTMKRTIGSRAIGTRARQGRAVQPQHDDRVCRQGRIDGVRWRQQEQPFAVALVEHLAKPGLDLRKAFGFVRDDVLKATNNTQEPFVYGSLGGNDVTLVPALQPAVAAPVDQDATMRRDYEFAERVGTKPVWDSFINKYPSGFFTALAKAQRDKLAAEAARLEATEQGQGRARRTDPACYRRGQGRRAGQGRRTGQGRRSGAHRRRTGQEGPKRPKLRKPNASKAAALAKAAEQEAEGVKPRTPRKDAGPTKAKEKLAAEQKAKEEKVAALTPPADKSDQPATVDLPRSLQAELRRVGCNTGAVDGNWNAASQRSLDLFNKHAGMKLDVKTASADALSAVKRKANRVCPLVCDHGFRADGERCTKITCRAGV